MSLTDLIAIVVILIMIQITIIASSYTNDKKLDHIATAIETIQVNNTSYITTPQVTINDGRWDVAETTD